MKKALLIMAAALMALCVSCKKDDDKSDGGGGGGNTGGGGSQTVEMRISKDSGNSVGYDEGSTDGGQTWNVIEESNYSFNTIYTWNDNLLSNVKSYSDLSDHSGYNNYDFRYDNNKLSNIIVTQSSDGRIDTISSCDVEYDGDNMSKVTVHHDKEDDRVYHLEYSNGKLSSVTFDRGVINYFWNGDNISEVIASGDYFIGDTVGYKHISYDDKKNPYYGIDAFLAISVMSGGVDGSSSLSKNNCTKHETYSGGGSIIETGECEYTYNGENYPTQAISSTIIQISDGHRQRGVTTVTYEYLD